MFCFCYALVCKMFQAILCTHFIYARKLKLAAQILPDGRPTRICLSSSFRVCVFYFQLQQFSSMSFVSSHFISSGEAGWSGFERYRSSKRRRWDCDMRGDGEVRPCGEANRSKRKIAMNCFFGWRPCRPSDDLAGRMKVQCHEIDTHLAAGLLRVMYRRLTQPPLL
jgi:hypothetical protein